MRKVIATLAGALAVTIAVAAAASAHVTWDPSSIHSIYDPADGFYAYAPSVIDDGRTRRIWTCHNAEFRVIRDHIFATTITSGQVVDDRSVLQATPGAWDSFHTCDPSIVKGRFSMDGTRYSYAMLYLGNDLDASAHNQIGVAFSKGPDGPWVKYPTPIVTSDDPTQWGVGQPSAVTMLPGTGRLLLFYTRGDTATRAYWRTVDFSDMAHPLIGPAHLLTTTGLTGADGGPDWLNGYDVAFDPTHGGRFYAIREQHPYPLEGDNPWWIGPSVQLVSMDATGLLRDTGTWQVEGDINPPLTGFARNHNAGIVRTSYGTLPHRSSIEVVFTDSCAGPTCDSLYSYDLWEITGTRTR